MTDAEKTIEIVTCSACEGKGLQGGIPCERCQGVGLWGFWHDFVVHTGFPKIIKFDFDYKLKRLLPRVAMALLWLAALCGLGATVRNVIYNIEIAHDRWYAFAHLGFIGWVGYLGLIVGSFLLYWYSSGRMVHTHLGTAQPEIPVSLDSLTLEQKRDWSYLKERIGEKNFLIVENLFAAGTKDLLAKGIELADKKEQKFFRIEHIWAILLQSRYAQETLVRLCLDRDQIQSYIIELLSKVERRTDEYLVIPQEVRRILIAAFAEMMYFGHDAIYPRDLWLASIAEKEELAALLTDLNVHFSEARYVAHWLDIKEERQKWWRFLRIDHFRRGGKINRGWLGGWTLALNRYSKDLTKAARKGQLRHVVGRTEIIEDMARTLARSFKSNIILIGEPGVGKTTLIEGLAHKIVRGDVDQVLADKRLVELNIASLVGAASNANQFGDLMARILKELRGARNVILCLDNIHTLKGTGAAEGSGLDAFGILEPALTRNEFQCIGTTSFKEYRRFVESNESFARCFEKIEVPEPDFEDTVRILLDVVLNFEHKHKVIVSYQAIKNAIQLSQKYLHEKVLPDKAVDLLDEASVLVSKRKRERVVTANDVADIIARKTNIPIKEVTAEESARLLHLEKILHKRMVDQEEAVNAVANAVRRSRVGLKDPDRPIANFLFVGPTGVGKTELAKTLAEAYFGHENIMVRLDMSEYQKTDSINRLIGSPPGHKDSAEGGQLTEAIRKRPFSLILLDEFEKASSNIHDIFLQVFDDGRLTDSSGRLVDFTNSIIIATSNAGAKMIYDGILQNRSIELIKEDLMKKVLPTVFKPELINRFDAVILFKPLTESHVQQIAGRMLAKIREKLKAQDIEFKITKEAVTKISSLGFDPAYGARPLRRVIQDKVEDPIAGKILRGEVNKGDVLVMREQDL